MTKTRSGSRPKPHPATRGPRRSPPAWRRSPLALGGIALVVLVVVAMAVVATLREPLTSQGSTSAGGASEAVQRVPASVLDAVGSGSGVAVLTPLPADTPPVGADRPEILYVGAEYCPFCAGQRWPLIVALSRFGTFSGLQGTESAAKDIYPLTQTFTFHGSTYTSAYLTFSPAELSTNQPDPSGRGYVPLEQLTAAERSLLARFDRPPYTTQAGAIPFLLLGNRFVQVGASYQMDVLQGKTRDEIVAALSDPSSPIASSVGGSANTLTAAICELTDGQPGRVCSSPTIAAIRSSLPKAR